MGKLRSARREAPASMADAFLENQEEEKKTVQKESKSRYGEPTKYVAFKFPESRIEQMKELAAFHRLSSTKYLLKLIADDYEAKKDQLAAVAKIQNKA